MKKIAAVAVFLAVFFGVLTHSRADEGMWTLNNLPLKQLKEKYGFTPTDAWIRFVQRSSARLPNCSSSFVSSDGLIMTNGHCAEDAVEALSTPINNLYERGFYAPTYAQELKTKLNLKILISTDKINIVPGVVDADKFKSTLESIQKEASRITGLNCEIVTLYQGAQYETYCYKVYNDIRLVFSTEKNVWFFGGDADNFEYPRYALDVAFLRAYEDGRPIRTPFHFDFSKNGSKPGELLFVSGHPGRTARLLTSAALKTERDVRVPFMLDVFRRRELTLQQFMLKGKEQTRIAQADLFSWQNSRKLYVGKIRGLQDPKLVEAKMKAESDIVNDPALDSSLRLQLVEGRLLIQEAQEDIRKIYSGYTLLARGLGFDSRLYRYAQSIVSGDRAVAESLLKAREKELPINLEYEEAKLRDSLTHLFEVIGSADPSIYESMPHYGNGPSSKAHRLVYETSLSNINDHQRMVESMAGARYLQQNDDLMINFVLIIKSKSEYFQHVYNNALEKERQGYAKMTDAMFKAFGSDSYPDATFTLRLSFGKMSGYDDNGKQVAPKTTIGGMYRHSAEFDNKGDYKLPYRWLARKQFVNLKTPLDFVSDLDITGGNSGSPVFNKDLEIVGIVFDSNIEGLVSDYDYNYAPNARAIAVHSSGIIEVLSKIYRAHGLVRELTAGQSALK